MLIREDFNLIATVEKRNLTSLLHLVACLLHRTGAIGFTAQRHLGGGTGSFFFFFLGGTTVSAGTMLSNCCVRTYLDRHRIVVILLQSSLLNLKWQKKFVENNARRWIAVDVLGWFLFVFIAKTKTGLSCITPRLTATTSIKKKLSQWPKMPNLGGL